MISPRYRACLLLAMAMAMAMAVLGGCATAPRREAPPAVDPAQALARGITPDALRQSVLKQAAERDIAADIVAQAPVQPTTQPKTVADSPLVKAAQAYGARQ